MNNNQIDICAVSYLNLALAKCEILMPYIDSNDKTPVWDGEIQVYRDNKHKSDWVRRIPIQVKGTTVGSISSNCISHKVRISDLENYSANGGAMFFVVLITDVDHRIYFKRLLPQDIQPILREYTESKKNKNTTTKPKKILEFGAFPREESEIVKLMNHFLHNTIDSRKVYSLRDFVEHKEFKITRSGLDQDGINKKSVNEIAKYINDSNTYKYITLKSLPHELLPLEHDENIQIFIGKSLPDIYNGIHVSKVTNGESTFYYMGSNPDTFKRSVIFDLASHEIKIGICGTLFQQIADISFVLEYSLFTSLSDKDRTAYTERLGFLLAIKRAWEQCGMKTDINLSELSDSEMNQLFRLSDILTEENSISDTDSEDKILKLASYNVVGEKFLLYKKYTSDRNYVWANPFLDLPRIWVAETNDSGEPDINKSVAVSAFMLFPDTALTKYSNTNYENIYKALICSDLSPLVLNSFVLKTQCNLILAYDIDNGNNEALDVALKYGKWLMDNTDIDKDYLAINELQIIKRRDEHLLPAAIERIIKLSESNNKSIQFASYVLLDSPDRAKKCFQYIVEAEKELLLGTPICVLYKKLLSNHCD